MGKRQVKCAQSLETSFSLKMYAHGIKFAAGLVRFSSRINLRPDKWFYEYFIFLIARGCRVFTSASWSFYLCYSIIYSPFYITLLNHISDIFASILSVEI